VARIHQDQGNGGVMDAVPLKLGSSLRPSRERIIAGAISMLLHAAVGLLFLEVLAPSGITENAKGIGNGNSVTHVRWIDKEGARAAGPEAPSAEAPPPPPTHVSEFSTQAESQTESASVLQADGNGRDIPPVREPGTQSPSPLKLDGGASLSAGEGAIDDANDLLTLYLIAVRNTISQQWAREGEGALPVGCAIRIDQTPVGAVIEVRVESCGATAVHADRLSTVVRHAQPLPFAGYEDVMQQQITIVF